MTPELNKIYQGDCVEVMRSWPDSCVDVVITDPPYGEKTHAGARTGGGNEKLITFASVTPEYMVDLARRLCVLSKRWVVMTCDWRHCAEIEKKCPDIFIRAGVWIKPNGMPQYTGDRPATGWEAVAILHRPGVKKWNGGGSHAVWNVPKVSGDHPTQKPLDLIVKWMHLFSNEGETVLDPFCGSGTTLVAAEKMGRSYVGIEMDEKYIDLTKDRLRAESDQPRMI
jgi:site-specific DNA-methyltransferase (adenine-specific)